MRKLFNVVLSKFHHVGKGHFSVLTFLPCDLWTFFSFSELLYFFTFYFLTSF